jgi:hypothetical protein
MPPKSELQLDSQIEPLQEQSLEQGQVAQALAQPTETDTRNELAKNIAKYYFGILVLIIIGVPVYNLLVMYLNQPTNIISIKDAILTYSAVIGPTFGLVIAYYFKSKND